MKTRQSVGLILTSAVLLGFTLPTGATALRQIEGPSIILVTIDGVRWREMVRGADPVIVDDKAQDERRDEMLRRFVTPADRAHALTPFIHDALTRGGVLLGDRDHGTCMRVANPYWFSYPGYAELLTGRVDRRNNTNEPVPNPDDTVLGWLSRQPGFKGRVRAYASWRTFHSILGDARTGLSVNAGREPEAGASAEIQAINRVQAGAPDPGGEDDEREDTFTQAYALHALKLYRPRVLYVAFGETDSRAHEGAYDEYLLALNRADGFIRDLWATVQADPARRGRTTLIVTTDHGRGPERSGSDSWRDHGSGLDEQGVPHPESRTAGSDETWAMVLGSHPLGLLPSRGDTCNTSGQIAATILVDLGMNWRRFDTNAAPPLPVGAKTERAVRSIP